MNASKRRGLGRGLDALLSSPVKQEQNNAQQSELQKLPIELLQPGKYQPRKDMSTEALEDLSRSIKSQGIIQPIVVRPIDENEQGIKHYEIIAGERRWRAAQLAEIDIVPCIIKDVPDESAVAIALIENIQREDLNAMEEAVALYRLLSEFELTHQEVADAVGKSRTTVSNLLRLNSLTDEVKTLLEHGDIEMGHARALLALDDNLQAITARTVAAKELTVRETENLVKKTLAPEKKIIEKNRDPDTISLEQHLSEKLGSAVSISHNNKGKGKLIINYSNLDELDGILTKIH